LYDYHLHTSFSDDAETPMNEIIEAAIAAGLDGIALTDHFDPLYPDEDFPCLLDIRGYETALTAAKERYADRLPVAKGIELGLMPGEALNICRDVVRGYDFDFVIASIHSDKKHCIHQDSFHKGRTLAQIIERYYSLLLDSITTYKDYDVLGHLNVIDRYTKGFAPEDLYMPYVDEILRLAIADGKGIEINTSAFRYGLAKRGTPTPAILRRYRELGGELVTIGSDAHRARDVGAFLEEGEAMLRAAGLRRIAVYMNRKPALIKLPE
jgi:histidinol-phosphatase (PHP family)